MTTTGREDNIAEESTLAILPVCCFLFFGVFLKSLLLSPTCWLWQRDNDEEDGGDDDQRDERTTLPKNVCWLYYLSVVFFLVVISGLPHADYGRGIMTRRMVVTTTGREDNIKVRWLYYLSVVFFNLFAVSHMLAMAEGQPRDGWW